MTEIDQTAEPLEGAIAHSDHKPLSYERLLGMIEHSAVSANMAVQIRTQLKRVAVAIGALSGRALGVHDFSYRWDRRHDPQKRKLHMWIHSERKGQWPHAELTIELTPEGYIYRHCDLLIAHSQPQVTPLAMQ